MKTIANALLDAIVTIAFLSAAGLVFCGYVGHNVYTRFKGK